MINKKNVLGKKPAELGVKDAVHVAIVSVRAANPIRPGQRCGINEYGEAVVSNNGVGIADPFLRETIPAGGNFQLMLNQDEIANVRHDWDHPSFSFRAPCRSAQRNKYIAEHAKELGVTYEQIMDAAAYSAASSGESLMAYPGSLNADQFDSAWDNFDRYSFWSEWADESGHEFPNEGSECCPEYDYPRQLFEAPEDRE